ncbi:MAG: DUF6062 family protein [Defluviitaleaceae bacterium]|nr:DUF6062 family protein [Defluviitaleaceae bacterium]
MPDHIHTIPVLDALRAPGGCAFCAMADKLEHDAIQFMMGPAYMEDDVRMQTNRTGFCARHLDAMYKEQNRLGLGLMLHTYMQQLNKDTDSIIKGRIPVSFLGKDRSGTTSRLKNHLQSTHENCYLCNKVDGTFERYVDTFFYLWGKGGDDARLIKAQKGYCIPHFIVILSGAEKLGRSKREKFLDEMLPAQQEFMREMEEDLEWFTLKFDHRNADEPWKNAKDALPRALALLGGKK